MNIIEVRNVCEVLEKIVVMYISVVRCGLICSVGSVVVISKFIVLFSVLLIVNSGVSVLLEVLLFSVIDYEVSLVRYSVSSFINLSCLLIVVVMLV